MVCRVLFAGDSFWAPISTSCLGVFEDKFRCKRFAVGFPFFPKGDPPDLEQHPIRFGGSLESGGYSFFSAEIHSNAETLARLLTAVQGDNRKVEGNKVPLPSVRYRP